MKYRHHRDDMSTLYYDLGMYHHGIIGCYSDFLEENTINILTHPDNYKTKKLKHTTIT